MTLGRFGAEADSLGKMPHALGTAAATASKTAQALVAAPRRAEQ